MAAGDEEAGPLGRTDVSSLTEMVSLVTGDSGSGLGEEAAAAAGKQKMMSLSQWHHCWLVHAQLELKLMTKDIKLDVQSEVFGQHFLKFDTISMNYILG